MFIRKKEIGLRALEPADAALLFRWENDRDIWQLSETLIPFSMFQIEQFILDSGDLYSSKQLRMMIDLMIDQGEPETIGAIDLYDFDPRNNRAGVGIYIANNYRERGYGNIALELCINYVFGDLFLHQLYCLIAEDNVKSIRLFEKNGFVRTGVHKDWLHIKNRYIDQYHYQLINKTLD